MSLIRKKKNFFKKLRKEKLINFYQQNINKQDYSKYEIILNELEQDKNICKNLEELFNLSKHLMNTKYEEIDIYRFIIFFKKIYILNNKDTLIILSLKFLINYICIISKIDNNLNYILIDLFNHILSNYNFNKIFNEFIILIFNYSIKRPGNYNIILNTSNYFLDLYWKGAINLNSKIRILTVTYWIKLIFYFKIFTLNYDSNLENLKEYFDLWYYIIKTNKDSVINKNVLESLIIILENNYLNKYLNELFIKFNNNKKLLLEKIKLLYTNNHEQIFNANILFLNIFNYYKDFNKKILKNSDFKNYLLCNTLIRLNYELLKKNNNEIVVINSLNIINLYIYFNIHILDAEMIDIFNKRIKEGKFKTNLLILNILEKIQDYSIIYEIFIIKQNWNIFAYNFNINIKYQISILSCWNYLLSFKNNLLFNEIKSSKLTPLIYNLNIENNQILTQEKNILIEKWSMFKSYFNN